MNLRKIHIKYRFYFQTILFVLFLAYVAASTHFLIRMAQSAQQSTDELNSLLELSETARLNYVSFLYYLNANDEFYQTGSNAHVEAIKTSLLAMEDTLKSFTARNRFADKLAKLGWNDTLTAQIDKVQTNFLLTSLTLKELGSENSGHMGRALSTSSQIKLLLQPYPYASILNTLAKLQFSESEYLFSEDHQAYNDVLFQLDMLRNDTNFVYLDYSLQDEVQQNAETYKNYLSLIKSSLFSLGNVTDQKGLYPEMNQALQNMQTATENYIAQAMVQQQRYARLLWIIGLCIMLLIAALYVYLFMRFYKHVYTPVEELSKFSQNLSKGQKNVTPLNEEAPAEYAGIFNNLNVAFHAQMAKRQFVDDLLKQNFDSELNLQGKNDQFGKTLLALKESMRKARNEELRHAEENKRRQYQNEGIAKFAEILRSHNDKLSLLADEFIKEIVRYMEAIQGGLFLTEDEGDDTLNLVAAFAYNRKKYLTRSIRIGETLVGTCAQEKKTTHLNQLPENYIEITSGLGDTPPTHLLLVPIMHDEILIGVLEMASLKSFEDTQIQLCEKICDSLASTIINARISTRTANLLEKSQQQAAEMAEQEEEMRQNMEELQATQEESQRREEELEGFLEAIDQTFYVLEYNTDGSIIKVNQRFLYLTDLTIDKVIGKKHQELFGSKSKADSAFFANISEGNSVELTEMVTINDKKLEIKNTFAPEKTRGGETTKILNIMTVVM